MAEDFKLTIKDEYKEFATEFVERMGIQMPRKMLEAGHALNAHLAESTARNLNKHPTGALLRAWTVGPVKVGDKGFKVDVFNLLPYAMIQETGGVIRPKRVKALAIPNRDYSPIMRNQVGIAPRDYDPGRTLLKFYPAIQPGKLRGYLVDKNTGQLAYTLMAHVRIKPTGYITEGVKAATPEIVEIIDNAVVTAMGIGG